MTENFSAPGKWKSYDVTLVAGTIVVDTRFSEVYEVIVLDQPGSQASGGQRLLAEFKWNGLVPSSVAGLPLNYQPEMLLASWSIDGLTPAAGVISHKTMPRAGIITKVSLALETGGGNSGSTIVDVHKATTAGAGTTIFTTQTNRPELAHDATDGSTITTTNVEVNTFAEGDQLIAAVDAVPPDTSSTGVGVEVWGYLIPESWVAEDAGNITHAFLYADTLGADLGTSIQYCRVDDGGAFVDEDAAAKDVTGDDVELLVATIEVDDAVYHGIADSKFQKITFTGGTDAVDLVADMVYEYYNGTAWVTLIVVDGTSDYSDLTGTEVTWTIPSDWAQVAVDSVTAFWVRNRVTDYTSVTTLPQGDQITLGIAVIVDIDVEGTTVFTDQEDRLHLYDDDADKIAETVAAGIAAGSFAKGEKITANVDYAAPILGTQPADLTLKVYGSLATKGVREGYINTIAGNLVTILSDNLKSVNAIRVLVRGIV